MPFLLFIFLSQHFEIGQGAFDSFGGNAEGNAHVTGAAESVAGDDKQIVSFRSFGERHCVRLKRPGEQVECSARLYHVVTVFTEIFHKQIAVALVYRNVGSHITAFRAHSLKK